MKVHTIHTKNCPALFLPHKPVTFFLITSNYGLPLLETQQQLTDLCIPPVLWYPKLGENVNTMFKDFNFGFLAALTCLKLEARPVIKGELLISKYSS